jgi:hypothetical protein
MKANARQQLTLTIQQLTCHAPCPCSAGPATAGPSAAYVKPRKAAAAGHQQEVEQQQVLLDAGLVSADEESPLVTRKRGRNVQQSLGKEASPSGKQGRKPAASRAKPAAAKARKDKAPSPLQVAPAISKAQRALELKRKR